MVTAEPASLHWSSVLPEALLARWLKDSQKSSGIFAREASSLSHDSGWAEGLHQAGVIFPIQH